MNDRLSKILVPGAMLSFGLFAVFLCLRRPAYLNSTYYLGGLIFLQILVAALWNYRQRFLPLMLLAFLFAGTVVPFQSAWTSGRWFVLVAGALAGYIAYMSNRQHNFTIFHLVALFTVLAAVVSAIVSNYPTQALLKAASLLLLFLYGSAGARLALVGREKNFARGLLLGCEILIYASAVCYFVFRFEVFDNPNSLGATAGVVLLPVMLWGILTSHEASLRRRRTFAFLVTMLLLLSSYARAGIVAAVISCALICIVLRQYRMLIKGIGATLLAALMVIAVLPFRGDQAETLTSFVYKGAQEDGVLASRKSAWQRTSSVIREHPWFGSGFGTSSTRDEVTNVYGTFASAPQATREHGNSYLAIMEWAGLLGVLPFYSLVILLLINAGRVFQWIRQTGERSSLALPFAAIIVAGLAHAAFEDWLFAVGYYLTVFFWTCAFLLIDVLPPRTTSLAAPPHARYWQPWVDNLGALSPHR